MAGCSVCGCSNRSDKGFIMKHFPRDPQRRKAWLAKMKLRRKDWTPTLYSVICEVHFAPEMWEKTRVDGKRKLKCSAIPTLFTFDKPVSAKRKPKKPVTIPVQVADINMPSTSTFDHAYAASTDSNANNTSTPCQPASDAKKRCIKVLELKSTEYSRQVRNIASTDTDNTSIPCQSASDAKIRILNALELKSTEYSRPVKNIASTDTDADNTPISISVKERPKEPVTILIEVADINMASTSTSGHARSASADTNADNTSIPSASDADQKSIKALELKCTEYSEHYRKLFTKYRIIKNNLRNCQMKLKAAMNVNENDKFMKSIFNEDQIKAMKRQSTKFMKWSNATVQRSLKLKSACGNKGYKELLQHKYPLPSLRTLRRHQEKLKLETMRLSEV